MEVDEAFTINRDEAVRFPLHLQRLIYAGMFGLLGCAAFFLLGALDEDLASSFMLGGTLMAIFTLLFIVAATRLRSALIEGKPHSLWPLALVSGLNLVVLGVPIFLGITVSTFFGFGIMSEEGGLGFGAGLVGFAVFGALFFVIHISTLLVVLNIKRALR